MPVSGDPNKALLDVTGISVSFDERLILDDISLSLNKGELVSLVGSSGVGKTTLFNVIAGLLAPDKGDVFLSGQNITGKTGYVSYMMQKDLLLENMRVADNVALPLRLRGVPRKQAYKESCELLPDFGLEGTEDLWPAQLSGGMRQRAALARTYLFSSEVFLLDEPFSALDAFTKADMHKWFLSVREKLDLSVLFVTHDIDEAVLLSDRILVLTRKGIVGQVTVSQDRSHTVDFALQDDFLAVKRQVMQLLQS